jgi:DNA-binding GntR family transcriptional regulator
MTATVAQLPTIDRQQPIGPQVYLAIRAAIMSLRLTPGQALSEVELAQRFGVSKTPVREAFIKLADEGLVQIYPQQGTKVSLINITEACEYNLIRQALESTTIRYAAETITPLEIAELRRIVADQRAALARQDSDAFTALNDDFHRRLIEISGFRRVWKVVASTTVHVGRLHALFVSVPGCLAESIEEHERIIACLERGDEEGAVEVLQHHLDILFDELEPLVLSQPELFTGDPGGVFTVDPVLPGIHGRQRP